MSGELQGQEQLHSVKGSTDMVDNKTYNSRGTAYAHPGHICDNSQYPWSPIGLQHQQLVLGIDTSMGGVSTALGTVSNKLHAGCVRQHFNSACIAMLVCS